MKLEGKWQLIGCHVLDTSQEFQYDEVFLNFKSLDFIGVNTGFLKTSIKTERLKKSSIQTFKWEFRKLTHRLRIRYVSSVYSEVFHVRSIDHSRIELRSKQNVLLFKKTL